jgi:signal transduction histidine kinase
MAQTTELSLKMLKKLLSNEKDLHYLLDNINYLVIVIKPNFDIVLINNNIQEYALKLFNREVQIGENLYDIIPSLQNGKTQNLFNNLKRGEPIKLIKKAIINKGFNLWFEFTFIPVLDDNYNIEFIVLTGNDLTILKRAEEEIHENKLKVKSQHIDDIHLICKFDQTGNIHYANNEFCKFLNEPIENIMETNYFNWFPEYLQEKVRSDIYSLTITNPQKSFIEIMNGSNSIKNWISGIYFASFDSDDNLVSVQMTGIDYTVSIKSNNELIKEKEKAVESEHIKSVFYSNISHEIRTPLNGILGFSTMLNTVFNNKEKLNEYVKLIQQSGKQLLGIIDDLLEISMLETNNIKLHFSRVYLPNIIINLFDFFVNSYSEKKRKIKLIKDIPVDGPNFIYTDGMRLYQVFMKLIHNSIKFTNKGKIEFGYQKINKNLIRFYVRDTGIGIAPDKQDYIFNSFRQADESLTRLYGGNGLGLSIAKSLVKKIGGKLSFESQEGQGSFFYFDLSVDNNLNAELIQSDSVNTRIQFNWLGKKILIVEDIYINYLLLKEFLKKTDALVIPANTGHSALDLIYNDNDIDLILLDIRLPDINGLEVARRIKEFNPNIIILAQTAYSYEMERMDALKAGCDGFLLKPIAKELLLKTINDYFYGN